MDRRLNGLTPLAYMGVNSINPPDLVINPVAPTVNDSQNISIGTLWLVYPEPTPPTLKVVTEIWVLTQLVGVIATWVQIYPAQSSGADTYNADTGSATQSSSTINMFGDSNNIMTEGSSNNVDINLSNGANGQTLIGGGSYAQWALLTSSSITITPDVNSLNLDIAGDFVTSFLTDDDNIAIPASGALTIHGGENLNTTGVSSVVQIHMNDDIVIPDTVTVDSLGQGVVQSSSAGLLSSSQGTNGQLLISSPTSALWNNLTSTNGTIGITNGSNSIDLSVLVPSGSGGVGNYAFLYTQNSNINNVTGDGTIVSLGSLAPLTQVFDVGSNVYPGNGTGSSAYFMAPATGYYFLQMEVSMNNPATQVIFSVNTPARSYIQTFNGRSMGAPGIILPVQAAVVFCVIVDMNLSDQATFSVQGTFFGFNKTMGLYSTLTNGSPSVGTLTSISGFKIG